MNLDGMSRIFEGRCSCLEWIASVVPSAAPSQQKRTDSNGSVFGDAVRRELPSHQGPGILLLNGITSRAYDGLRQCTGGVCVSYWQRSPSEFTLWLTGAESSVGACGGKWRTR
ncbi:uncharacterized protein AFUA_5G14160 [Aspergillus fumigatus Af293]|uniref:Uncharacterized protein n=2 Tax=Aspergillus fumigatus TaxID=746128 RepID=Q4WW23_ASPFU|nr:hypothetical protein AFUA_5G14160 [Aspergillus fumigatus Af293]EAL91203.1 hypothetical protein AFUA_5G14160 [Aspergillus fumigatus Af293]EDP52148.1 hypothetical protein AFUB_061850 [Aspergillus fumigatus A1163]